MIPRTLTLQNFMCYREGLPPLVLDGISIACLAGDNGAGKSALLDAITWALWGVARLKSDDDLVALGATEMMVDLEFTLDGQDYRVIRRRIRGKRGGQSQLDFQVRDENGWRSLTPGGVRETQQLIIQTLRMDYEIFANSAYLRQGRADEFTRKEPAKRKQVLADILGLSVYEDLESRAKERARAIDGQIRGLEGRIGELRRQAERCDLLVEEVHAAERHVADAMERVEAARQALETATASVQELETLRAIRDDRQAQIQQRRTERDGQAQWLERQMETRKRAEAWIARRAEIDEGIRALRAAESERDRLAALRDEYDRLQAQRTALVQALSNAEHALRADLRVAETQAQALREHAARRPRLVADLERLSARLSEQHPVADMLSAARARRIELTDRLRRVNDLLRRRTVLESDIKLKHDSLVATREEQKRILRTLADQLKHEARWRTELTAALAERDQLETAAARLDTLRDEERALAERIGAMRAECETVQRQGEQINEKLRMLGPDLQVCPLCKSELGREGIAHIQAEYERERQALRQRYAAAKREADHLEAQLKRLRGDIRAAEQRVAALPDLQGRIARLENDLERCETLRQQQIEAQRLHDDVAMRLMKNDYEMASREEIKRIDAEITALGAVETLEREIAAVERQIAGLEDRSREQAALQAQIDALRREIRQIDDEDPALHEQEQIVAELTRRLAHNDFAHNERAALAALDDQIAALGYSRERYDQAQAEVQALAHWEDDLTRLRRAEDWLAEHENEIARAADRLQQLDAQIAADEEEVQRLNERLRALASAARARDEARARLDDFNRELLARQRDLGERQADLRRAQEAARSLADLETQRLALLERKSLFDELTLAFGKKGVQAMLIETALPELEREANRLLSRMTDNQMHLTFETQRDTKKGDVAETLEIKIADALGTRVYDAYSGGEAFRLDFAIRVALSKLLARRAGARLETLIIDEGFGSQDARGRERLVEAIISVQHDFRRVLVITHIQELKDMFPVQIEIVKTPNGSVWNIV
ncbi:MAG: SMC family ATPase [Roseiflexaceae bacterium]|nr:SMC family ATPase [Roseiflexaceae bacterium]